MQDTAAYVRAQAAAARNAYYAVSAADTSAKNAALLRTAELLDKLKPSEINIRGL